MLTCVVQEINISIFITCTLCICTNGLLDGVAFLPMFLAIALIGKCQNSIEERDRIIMVDFYINMMSKKDPHMEENAIRSL